MATGKAQGGITFSDKFIASLKGNVKGTSFQPVYVLLLLFNLKASFCQFNVLNIKKNQKNPETNKPSGISVFYLFKSYSFCPCVMASRTGCVPGCIGIIPLNDLIPKSFWPFSVLFHHLTLFFFYRETGVNEFDFNF